MSKEFSQAKHMESYLKKLVPNWNPDVIEIPRKTKYHSDYYFIIVVDGKIKRIPTYLYTDSADKLITKLKEYFDTGHWDDKIYYKTEGEPKLDDFIIVFDHKHTGIQEIRNKYNNPNIGFTEVDKGNDHSILVPLEKVLK